MNVVSKPYMTRGQGQRTWTAAQREEQSAKCRARQIWLKSTGPKTEQGKSTSSKNARHADYDQRQAQGSEMRLINSYLRTQKSYLDLLRLYTKQQDSLCPHRYYALNYQLFFLENELINIERQIFDGMTFQQVINRKSTIKNVIQSRTGTPNFKKL